MKGQAFDLMVLMVALVIASFTWIAFNHVINAQASPTSAAGLGETLYNQVNTTDQHYNIRLGQDLFYYSLAFLIILTFVAILRATSERGGG
jgi:TRAP-type C4-dicarboxylate transport system permease small subunit